MRYPKTLYVKLEVDGDDRYFVASDEPKEVVSAGESQVVGEYQLVKKVTVSAPVEVA